MTMSGYQTRLRSVNAPPKVVREKSAPKTPKSGEVQATLSQFFSTPSFDDGDDLDVAGKAKKRRKLSTSPVLLARDTFGEDSFDIDQELGIGAYAEDAAIPREDDGSWRPSSESRINPRRTSTKGKPKKRRSLAHEDTGTLTQAHNFRRLPSNIPSTYYEAESIDDSNLNRKPDVDKQQELGSPSSSHTRPRHQSPSLLEEMSNSMYNSRGVHPNSSPTKTGHTLQPQTPHNKYNRDLIIPSSHSPAVTPLSPYASSQKQIQLQKQLVDSPIKSWQSRLTENLMPPPKWKGKLKQNESGAQFPAIEHTRGAQGDGRENTGNEGSNVSPSSSSQTGRERNSEPSQDSHKLDMRSGKDIHKYLMHDNDLSSRSTSSGTASIASDHIPSDPIITASSTTASRESGAHSQQENNVDDDETEGSSQQRNVLSSTLSNMNLDKSFHTENGENSDIDSELAPSQNENDEIQATQESVDSIPNSTRRSRAAQLQNELLAHESYPQNNSTPDEGIEVRGTPIAQLQKDSSHDEVIYDTQDEEAEGEEESPESQPTSLPVINLSPSKTTTTRTTSSRVYPSTNNDNPDLDKVQAPSSQIMELTEAILQSESYSQYHKTTGKESTSNIFRENTFQTQQDNQQSRIMDSSTQNDNDDDDEIEDGDDSLIDDTDETQDSLLSSPLESTHMTNRVAEDIKAWKLRQFGPTQPILTVSQLLGGGSGGSSSDTRAKGMEGRSSVGESDEEL